MLVGGGHAHVHVLKSFGLAPKPGVTLTLVSKDVETPYSGMLPGLIAGQYAHHECHIDVAALARFAGARFIHAEAIGIDRGARQLLLEDRPPISYGLLSLDIGSTARFAVPGAEHHTVPIRPVDRFLNWLPELGRRARETPGLRIVVVGGGAGGVELLLSVQHRLMHVRGREPLFTLLTRGPLLRRQNKGVRTALSRILRERGVHVRQHAEAAAVEPSAVRLRDGSAIAFDACIWVAGPGAPAWLGGTGLALADGFVAVDPFLRSLNDPRVFAVGDVASMVEYPRPKAGVFAVRQGPPLSDNLRRAVSGAMLRPHVPQRRSLSLIGTGDRSAVAAWGPFHAKGHVFWRLKEWIDRRWIENYKNL